MSVWTEDELRRIGEVEELEIAPVRRNGELRRRTRIWVVRLGDALYVRAAYGSGSGWYGVARASGQARVWAGGIERDVEIEAADEAVLDQVDAGYRSKYGRYAGIVDALNQPEHRVNTVRLEPRETG